MSRNRRAPVWAETGLSERGSMAPEEQWQDELLERRIREEAGDVVVRPLVERLLPYRGKSKSAFVSVTKNGLSLSSGVREHAKRLGQRCHIEVDNGELVLRIIIADDGPWKLPGGVASTVGGGTLRKALIERGMKPGVRYTARIDGSVIEARFGKEGMRRAG